MMLRSAILRAFDAGSYTASVQMTGSLGNNLTGVAVSRAIPSGEMLAGRRVAVVLLDATNPGDCVVVAVWT